MNRTLGITASLLNIVCVAIFAICMPINSLNGCYLSSIGIALSFVLLLSAFAAYAKPDKRIADGGKPVRDHKTCSALHDAFHRFLDQSFQSSIY